MFRKHYIKIMTLIFKTFILVCKSTVKRKNECHNVIADIWITVTLSSPSSYLKCLTQNMSLICMDLIWNHLPYF